MARRGGGVLGSMRVLRFQLVIEAGPASDYTLHVHASRGEGRRQNLSQYLERVGAGERFEVTERNLPVAILAPLPGRSSALERLISDGRLIAARLDLAKLGPPVERPHDISISKALEEQRGTLSASPPPYTADERSWARSEFQRSQRLPLRAVSISSSVGSRRTTMPSR